MTLAGHTAFHDELRRAGVVARPGARLAAATTFQVGGPVDLLDCATPGQVAAALAYAVDQGLPWRVLGGGSNIVAVEAGLPGVVIRFRADQAQPAWNPPRLTVSGAAPLDALVAMALDLGLAGLTALSGIPGTVGGAISGNAGAFGVQVGDCLESVDLLTPAGRAEAVPAADLGLGYRASGLPQRQAIVLQARFRLAPAPQPAAERAERERIRALRREKHPDWRQWPSAGSVFRNLDQGPGQPRAAAGRLLEQAGAKAMRHGGVRVFERHANIIIKDDPAGTAEDVYALMSAMRDAVREKFGVVLAPEIRFWGAAWEQRAIQPRTKEVA